MPSTPNKTTLTRQASKVNNEKQLLSLEQLSELEKSSTTDILNKLASFLQLSQNWKEDPKEFIKVTYYYNHYQFCKRQQFILIQHQVILNLSRLLLEELEDALNGPDIIAKRLRDRLFSYYSEQLIPQSNDKETLPTQKNTGQKTKPLTSHKDSNQKSVYFTGQQIQLILDYFFHSVLHQYELFRSLLNSSSAVDRAQSVQLAPTEDENIKY